MENNYVTISQINTYIKGMFDNNTQLKKVYLKGEISNFKRHTTGHLYLTLKDDYSRMSAIMFRSSAQTLTFNPEDGMNVLVEGRISVYPAGGSYQIYIDKMEQGGLGNLYIEYEKLKKKLASEGLFSMEHKRPIPKFPTRIGIVTAPTGAAIKDILSTIKRRYPICETILFPALVQGISAAPSVAKQIKKAQEYPIDVLIVGRGGGSIEDLWAFNEEIVARAIYESKIPVISAVGHEVDFTIADFVADLRAPTPTGAAEMAVPTILEVKNLLKSKEVACSNSLMRQLQEAMHRLKAVEENYVFKNPMVLYDIKMQKLDLLRENVIKSIKQMLDRKSQQLNYLQNTYILKNPMQMIEPKLNIFQKLNKALNENYRHILQKKEMEQQLMIQTLKLVNPLNILDKGYSLVTKENTIIKDIKYVLENDKLDIRLSKGSLLVEVKEKRL